MGWNQYYVPKHALFTKYNVFCTNLPDFWKSTRKFGQSEIALPHIFFFKNILKGGKKDDFDINDIEFPMSEFALLR